MNVAEGGMWHFGFFMAPHVPEMLFDGHEREFITATFTAMSNPAPSAPTTSPRTPRRTPGVTGCAAASSTTARCSRAAGRTVPCWRGEKVPMPVLAIGTAHSGTATAQALSPHAGNVRPAVSSTGHFVAEEDPHWFIETVTEFLA
jgi:hypothetical protein